MRINSLACLTSLIALVLGATVQDVVNDLTVVQTATTNLDNSLNNFAGSGATVVQALEIHLNATALQSALDATTADAKTITPIPISDTDAQSILDVVNVNVPIVLDCLSAAAAKKATFAALPVGGIPEVVLADLKDLNASDTALANALVSISPADILGQANEIIAQVNAGFVAAIATYES